MEQSLNKKIEAMIKRYPADGRGFIASRLNLTGVRTETGKKFTSRNLSNFLKREGIKICPGNNFDVVKLAVSENRLESMRLV